ncbi:hypothetical protein Trydic_g9146 [Trypoxylus dichotomus]
MATQNRNSATTGIKQFDRKGFYAWKIRIRATLDELSVLKVIGDDLENMSERAFDTHNRKAKNLIIQNLQDRILHTSYDKKIRKNKLNLKE